MNTLPTTHKRFHAWLEDADIPVETDNGWVDLETGISFADSLRAPTVSQRRDQKLAEMSEKHGPAIIAAEATAKNEGWAALTGTAPQKAWAAQIRANLIPLLTQNTASLAARIKPSKFWIEKKDMDIQELSVLIMSMRVELEAAATVRKEASSKAKATRILRKTVAAKIDARDAIIFELLDTAHEIPTVPARLGNKIIEQDEMRVFIDSATKLVTFIIKSSERKVVRLATLDADREARMMVAMS